MDSAFIRFYATLNRGKFKYFVRGDALFVCKEDLRLLPAALVPADAQQRGMAKFSSLDAVVRDCLLKHRVAVEEYTQQADGSYRLTRAGHPSSPGDFADVCLGASLEPALCAVTSSDGRVEFSYVSGGKILSTAFADDDLHSNLYSLVSSNNCVEMLHRDPHLERIALGWGVASVLVECRETGRDVTARMIRDYLKRDLPAETFTRQDCCLVDIRDYDLVDHGLMTSQGSRLLSQWLRAPSTSLDEINRRLDSVEVFAELDLELRGCSDLKRLIVRILSRRITLQETIRLYQALQDIPEFIARLEAVRRSESSGTAQEARKRQILAEDFVEPLRSVHSAAAPFLAEVEAKLDVEAGGVRPGLTKRLAQLEAERAAIYDEIENEYLVLKKVLPRAKYQARAWKVPRSDYTPELFDKQRYVVLSVAKTGVTFLTARLSKSRDALDSAETALVQEQTQIFETVRSGMPALVGSLEVYNFTIALMDIFKTLSAKCALPEYSRPVFSDSAYCIEGFFHPLLENREPILNDISFGETGAKPHTLCMLTGPNMGGKSTVLKAISTISLYAQIGAYVPARRAVLPVFDKIFMRIGAKDHSAAGLSTFMVEMRDLSKILRTATPRSLILIDELGRGTAALDGLGLVAAVKEHLISLGAHTIMATHFSEVVGSDTMNLRMGVAQGKLIYRLQPGIADSSFGINTAVAAGFPKEVIDSAIRYLGDA
ncbi:DNA mismatch repair protein MSH2 [Pancytospora philotis]|nr:DNA mismatch repair protein MSH2 [Pancytospora philotis]